MTTTDDKLRILYLMRILLQETDPAHFLNATELCERLLNDYQMPCERKTIYSDIKRLQKYGMKIGQLKGRTFGYYVEERDFSLPELKLLVDAVQSSKFITKEKSEELIQKLERLTSQVNAKQLQRQVFIYNRIKTDNHAIYHNVDAIHEAINENRQILFKYSEWTVGKKLVQKKSGADYLVSPWALTWDHEKYYLVGFEASTLSMPFTPSTPSSVPVESSETVSESVERDTVQNPENVPGKIKHYRVDKMQDIRVTDQERLGKEHFQDFDLAAYASKTFGMFGGPDRNLTLEGSKEMAGVMIDRFGTDVMMQPYKEDQFQAFVTVAVSPQFFGWLAGLGDKIRIISPTDIRDEYKTYLQNILDCY